MATVARSSFGWNSMSASVNSSRSPVACFAPTRAALHLPAQSAGQSWFCTIFRRGSAAAMGASASNVPSVQRSNTKITSSDGHSLARMLRAARGACACSLCAGTITETVGSTAGSGRSSPCGARGMRGKSRSTRTATSSHHPAPAPARATSTHSAARRRSIAQA